MNAPGGEVRSMKDDGPGLFDRTPFDDGMEGSERAGGGRPRGEKTQLLEAIRALGRSGREFTSDDMWEACPDVPIRKDAGSLLTTVAREGLIENTRRRVVSHRGGKHDHAQTLSVWRGKS